MVSPAHRRAVVRWAAETYQLSERRACRSVRAGRSSVRYRSRRPDDAPVRRRLHELAGVRLSFGVKRLTTLRRREGMHINHTRVYRLYVAEGLQLKPRRRRRRKAGMLRTTRTPVTQPNQRWAMDFMHDVLSGGRTCRIFTLVDVYTRECLALVAAPQFTGTDVAAILSRVQGERATLPTAVQCDNGTEFTSTAQGSLGVLEQSTVGFQSAGKAGRQLRLRSLQRLVATGVPDVTLVRLDRRRAGRARSLAAGLQQPPTPQELGAAIAGRLVADRQSSPSRCCRAKLTLPAGPTSGTPAHQGRPTVMPESAFGSHVT